MSEYEFDPKKILSSIISIYICFKEYKEFLEFVVKDERSYNIENFERVVVLKENGKITLDYDKFDDYKSFLQMLKDLEIEIKAKHISYDDAPDEYLDPITTVLMEDPVMLPASNMILDRATIATHLLSDPTDPFNRSMLTIEEVISCPELKSKILEYRKSKQINQL